MSIRDGFRFGEDRRDPAVDTEGIGRYPRPPLEHGFDDPDRPREITVFDDTTTGDSGIMTNWLTLAPADAAVPMEEWR